VGAFSDLFARLDTDPRVRGKQFEHVCKWFLTNDPMYKHELRRVWLWHEWPGRWGIDAGIDLVAEDRNGRLWSIQAKAYDPTYRVTKRDVNKFLAESGREVFTYRMLIATTNLIDRIGERTIQDQEKRVTFFRLNDLQAAEVDWPRSPEDLRPVRPRKPARPRKHQREAIAKVLKGFECADHGQLIMACGTGKTLTALFINEEVGAARTLVLVPSLSLLKQTLNVWRANCTTEFASLPVCSDDTVANADDDVALAHTSDLGVPVTTGPEEIAAFLRQRSGPRVVFATYQSSPQIARAFSLGRVPAFDLVIADEAHRCAGPISSDFATVLDPVDIKAKRRLFMTATPRYFTGRVLNAAEEAEFEYASMDDEAKFGKVFHRLGFGEAIKRELLTDYQVAIVGVDDTTYLDWARRGVLVTRDGVNVTDAASLAGQIGLAKAIRKYDLHRVISFHSRVKRAREFAEAMPGVLVWMPARQRPKGELWSEYASGEMPAGDRYVLLQHLGRVGNGERGLLANARCLAEGVDVPTLDGVAFIDPRRSEVDIVQAVGRAIRKSEDKTVGSIVIPVFIDTDADPEVALDSSVFKPVWDVIKALRAHDEELGEQLDELRREMGRIGAGPRLPEKIHFDVPTRVGADFARAFEVRLVEQSTLTWEFWFGLLKKYVERRGTSRVPHPEVLEGYKLGGWVSKQRGKYNTGTLPVEKQRRLESLPDWSWAAHGDRWEESFAQLCDYVAENGTALVPNSCVWKGFPLGGWINRQRTMYDRGKIDPARQRRLEELPGWSWDVNEYRWEQGFRYLTEYIAEHGSAQVPAQYVVNGYNLGKWVFKQRANYRNEVLDPERIRRLEALAGWSWSPHSEKWEKFYAALAEYAKLTGTSEMSSNLTVNGLSLGTWARNQRSLNKRGELDRDRARRLESLPGWRWERDFVAEKWEEGFRYLEKYVEQNGDSRVSHGYQQGGYNLGTWVHQQRSTHQKGKLKPAYVRRLEALPGWLWESVRDERWETGFRHLQEFVKEHRHARIPAKCVANGYGLGTWVNSQRTNYMSGTLDKGRVRRLESVPGWVWDARADLWDEGFQHLLNYVAEHGDARVPRPYMVGDYRLGQWVGVQRSGNSQGTLTPERRRRLEELPGWSRDIKTDSWEEGFRKLLEFVDVRGTSRVPQSYSTGGFRLGIWVTLQRKAYFGGTLNDDQVKRLGALPQWSWNPREDAWEEGFRRLAEYTRQHGQAQMPQTYTEADGYKLGSWVTWQRTNRDKGVLSEDRIKRLEALPGWSSDPGADAWEEHYTQLLDFVAEYGTSRVPPTFMVGGFRLGGWVHKQRENYRAGKLTKDRQRRLQTLPGWRWSRWDT
jgi:superfamily II DNA or RNA helicase